LESPVSENPKTCGLPPDTRTVSDYRISKGEATASSALLVSATGTAIRDVS
jgi:hypothetical protein